MTRLEAFASYALFAGVIMLVAFGLAVATKATNVKVEARCTAQGGQVIVTPGQVSRCLLPAAR
jgi:hypothetical protein